MNIIIKITICIILVMLALISLFVILLGLSHRADENNLSLKAVIIFLFSFASILSIILF